MKKRVRSRKKEAGPYFCGPALSEWLRRFGPPVEARRHFEAARIEMLKGLRALVDARIAQCAKSNRRKGEKITVE